MLYPLRFDPVYIEKPWGGRGLSAFKQDLPPGSIGESWEVSAHPEGDTIVSNGPLRGRRLSELGAEYGPLLLGTRRQDGVFPLMIRYVCSRENLSIQLHPTASYARKVGLASGKDEAWFVLAAEPGAFVYAGLQECTRAQFRDASLNGTLGDLAVKQPVQAGDFISIPAGTVHAICAGLTLIEICENSNVTYRLFDYARDRGLDLDDGYEVVDVDARPRPHRGLAWRIGQTTRTTLCIRDSFAITRLDINGVHAARTDPGSFTALTCVAGELTLASELDGTQQPLLAGQTVLLPAALGRYTLSGEGTVLDSHLPDVAAERAELATLLT